MRLDLAERLRCPRRHAPTPLIVLAEEVVGRDLIRGTAGCVTCHLEAQFTAGDLIIGAATLRTSGAPDLAAVDNAALDRLQALLGLAEPEGCVLLTGPYRAFADSLGDRCDVTVVTLDGTLEQFPFTDGTLRAAAIDPSLAPMLAADLPRCLTANGRLVATATVGVPAGIRELARDEREWVGERDSTSGIVELLRRR